MSNPIACPRAATHTAHCSGGEGHPHRDCYCGSYWNDGEPKSPCPECATCEPTAAPPEPKPLPKESS